MNNKKILRSNLKQSYYNKKDNKEQNIPTDKESMQEDTHLKKKKKVMKENMKE